MPAYNYSNKHGIVGTQGKTLPAKDNFTKCSIVTTLKAPCQPRLISKLVEWLSHRIATCHLGSSMVWSALPPTTVQLGTVLMHSDTAHMPQPTMYSPVANLQQVAKLACIMLRNVTPGWIRTPRPML